MEEDQLSKPEVLPSIKTLSIEYTGQTGDQHRVTYTTDESSTTQRTEYILEEGRWRELGFEEIGLFGLNLELSRCSVRDGGT
ncbi:hypothetical protein C453_01005 [Haloferax elongans ATCC BAA-1513]|uniref:Uncharacterized protein n=1 Tax=Haloferax elongans ATCC BAA-1513 TaxID=1230453 RepID=M0HYI7_HALEO|nr:hypothetical protein C453_01005 [Haloferax elongans ATCC BAA-1513]